MARSKPKLIVDVEYALARLLVGFLRIVPPSWAEGISNRIIRIVLFFIPKRRALMLANIAQSFPERTAQDHKEIASQSISNIAKGLAVFIHMPTMFKNEDLDWIDVEGLEHLEEGYRRGKGVVTFTAHYGCWEMMAALTMHRNPRVSAIYRALDNPRIDAFVKGIRSSSGGLLVERRNVFRHSLTWLKNNGLIGFLVDQNFAAGGVFVDFFGRLAATTPALSVLARRTGATILSTHNHWDGKRLRVVWGTVPPLSTNPILEQALAEDTQAMTKIIEGWIRQDPGHWMWLHNRWKRQPLPGETIIQQK